MISIISIVIPTWRRPLLLTRCIDALKSQIFPATLYEIIVITDGPDEETIAFIGSHYNHTRPAIHIHSLPLKKGPAAARNAGWKLAKGKLVLFTDDDCIPHRYWVAAYWSAWSKQPLEAMVFTGQVLVPVSKRPTDFEKNYAGLEDADFVTANCACTKTALQMVDGFDEEFPIAWREDSELEFRFMRHHIPIRFVQQAVVTHPVRKAGWGISLKEQKKTMYNALLYKKHPDLFRKKIYRHPFWNYYAMTLLVITGLLAAAAGWKYIVLAALTGWLVLLTLFILKRLKGTSRSFKHIIEMIVTSVLIPFLSVYWTLYGSYKFKSRLL